MEVIVGVIFFIIIIVIVNSIINSAEQQQKSNQRTNLTKEYTLPSGRKINKETAESIWQTYQEIQKEKAEEREKDPMGIKKINYISFLEKVKLNYPQEFYDTFGDIHNLNNLSLKRIEDIYKHCLTTTFGIQQKERDAEIFRKRTLDFGRIEIPHVEISTEINKPIVSKRTATSETSTKNASPIANNSLSTNNTIGQKRTVPEENLAQKKREVSVIHETTYPIQKSRTQQNIKPEHKEIKQYLIDNNIQYFYHFTDCSNLESIISHGGLYSWKHCMTNDIAINKAGGDNISRSLDEYYDLGDYVRLSFCNDHPMAYRLKKTGYDLVLLKIKIDVAWLKDTLFSNMNATDSMHCHGAHLSDLQRVDIDAIKATYIPNSHPYFKPHQAEILVKTHIPLEYIINIDNPIKL